MKKSIEELRKRSKEIELASVAGENTARRVGSLFADIVEWLAEGEDAIKEEFVRFLEGFNVGNYDYGIDKDGIANLAKLIVEEIVSDSLIVGSLTVTNATRFFELVFDKLRSIYGQQIMTAANAKFDRVDDNGDTYRCYFRTTDGERTIEQAWRTLDQCRCQTFGNNKQKYYWRLVTAVSESPISVEIDGQQCMCHYIDLSKTDKDGDGIPERYDETVQLGYRGGDDEQRQSAIIDAAVRSPDKELVAPMRAYYRGINDYDLSSHRKTYYDARGGRWIGETESNRNILKGAGLMADEINFNGEKKKILFKNSGIAEIGDVQEFAHESNKYVHLVGRADEESYPSANFYSIVKKGAKYTLSWWERVPRIDQEKAVTMQAICYKGGDFSSSGIYVGGASRKMEQHDDWRHIVQRFTAPCDGVLKVQALIIRDGEIFVSELQLEHGEDAGMWSNPDMEDSISAIKVESDKINLSIKKGLEESGIDIEHGEVTAKADNFKIKNNDGKTTFSIDGDGNLVSVGGAKFDGLLIHNESELTKKNKGDFLESDSSKYSQLDIEKLTPIIRIKDDVGKYDFALPPLENVELRRYYDNTFYIYNDSQATYSFWNVFFDLKREQINFGKPYLSLKPGEFIAVRCECGIWNGEEELIWVLMAHGKSKK